MMNIVIVGAGDVGRYIASILSREQHNVILIDNNPKKLEIASWSMDVATRLGSGTDWQLLDDLLELSPHLLIALTGSDETNFVACDIAKHLGYPRTIARVRDNRYLNRTRLDFTHIFDVDYLISPELLVANDILKYMISPGSIAIENFAHGAVQMRTILVPDSWRRAKTPLNELKLPPELMVGLIRRGDGVFKKKVIFPHGDDVILPGDEVTLIGETETISEIAHFFGSSEKGVQSVVIVGGSLTGLNLAKILEHRSIDVRLLEKDYDKCCVLADKIPNSTILHHDATDLEFLKAEKIGSADVIVSCTRNDEVNILTAMLGKEVGCQNAVVMLTNSGYIPLVSKMGIDHAVSPRITTTDHIMSQILFGTVTTLVSLYENRAEIIEINVSSDAKVVGIPLAELGPLLPKDFLIAAIQNRGRVMIANGTRVISPGDTVIVVSNPKHLHELETIF